MNKKDKSKISFFKDFKFHFILAFITGVLFQIFNSLQNDSSIIEGILFPVIATLMIIALPFIIWLIGLFIVGGDSKKAQPFFKTPFYIIWWITTFFLIYMIITILIKGGLF